MDSLVRSLGPSHDTLRYIVGHILAEKRCLVCGTDPSPAAPIIENWIRSGRCPICGSEHEVTADVEPLTKVVIQRIARLESELGLADAQISEAEARIAGAVSRFASADSEYEALERRRIVLDAKIVSVLRRIPTAGPARQWAPKERR